jgi:hypothetical protein
MRPQLPDLTKAGITTDAFVDRLFAYVGERTSPLWVVRWRGRIKSIEGIAFFTSRNSAKSQTEKWLRGAGRWALPPHNLPPTLPKNWCYKKTYRTFITQLLEQLEQEGVVEYVEIQPGIQPAYVTGAQGVVG